MAGPDKETMVHAWIYQQFNADYSLDVPAEGFNGWQRVKVPLDLERTALVVMHAWNCGTREQYPGWYRHVEYLPRAARILEEVFPPLISTWRDRGLTVFHVVGGRKGYYEHFPGYKRAKKLERKVKPWKIGVLHLKARRGKIRRRLDEIRRENCGAGLDNLEDIKRGFKNLDFAPQARPAGDEGIAENRYQLLGLCRSLGIDHLVYVGFAINWCLLLSPGGMAEMSQHGILCSTIRQAVTAVENHQTARGELAKEIALWRVALAFGFVFDLDDIMSVLVENLPD